MRAASNSLMRSMLRSYLIGSVQKAGYESQTPSEYCGRRLWASTTKLFCATIGDIHPRLAALDALGQTSCSDGATYCAPHNAQVYGCTFGTVIPRRTFAIK
jgi:hypothetical protein